MKCNSKSLLLVVALLAACITAGQAGPSKNWPWENNTHIKSKDQAEKLVVGTKVALACPDCKTVTEQKVDDKKSFLSWFKADSKHDCSGCKGQISLKSLGGGKNTTPEYVHVCSKCTKDSPFTCSGH